MPEDENAPGDAAEDAAESSGCTQPEQFDVLRARQEDLGEKE